ncbi:hypothetical protein BpHYR1_041033 [Brachionus plicatilis]|uniref:Uncharacterized protein n=1 Tax=Brachionus plicatilis TaxID=10195 RepID=A0A3M7PZT1_BRAPC|nr:hypothetical protein BpHYR1_041033 [Brachionus plicatilis]
MPSQASPANGMHPAGSGYQSLLARERPQMFKLANGINEVEWVNPPVLANSLSLTGPARGIRGHARRLSGQASIKCLQRANTFTNRVVNE